MRKLVGRYRHEPVEVFQRHADVDIVVPRDEPAVPHCAQAGPAVNEIGDMVLAAELVEGCES